CRFPRARDVGALWQVVRTGQVCFEPIRPERWDHSPFFDPDDPNPLDKAYTDRSAFVEDIDRFAAGHFGLAPRRAQVMDPQHRLVLETVHEALEDAGYGRRAFDRQRTGVFMGVGANEYGSLLLTRLRAMQMARGEFGAAADEDEQLRLQEMIERI